MTTRKPDKKNSPLRPGPSSNEARPFLLRHAGLIAFLTGAFLYANTLFHEYALDDAIVITENMFTQKGLSGIPGLLSYDTFYGFFKEEGKAGLVAGGRYRPLSPVTFALEQALFGGSPLISHLLNILLYGGLCTLLFLTLRRLLTGRFPEADAEGIALLAALLFAAHPLHTEVVANIKGRDEILALAGSLAAWLWTLVAVDRQRPGYLLAAGSALFLGLMSKENAITFLAVIPVSLWFFRDGIRIRSLSALWPLGLGALAFLILRGAIIGWTTGEPPMEMLNNPFVKFAGDRYVPFTAGEHWGTILFTLLLYLKLLVWPIPLTHDYYPRHIAIHNLTEPLVLASLLLYIALAVVVIRGWRSRSVPAFAAFYFLATLSIVSNIVFPVGTNMSERFLFMPSVGFALVLGWLIRKRLTGQGLAAGITLVLVLIWGGLTLARNPVWKDNFTLFTTDVLTSVNSAKLQNATGGELIARAILSGNEARKEAMLREAQTHLSKALEIHPGYKNACLLMGNALNYLREYPEAVRWYDKALAIDPDYREAKGNLQITCRDAGRYYGEVKGDLPQAIDWLNRSLAMKEDDPEVHRLLGIAYGIGKQPEPAIRHFTRALELNPGNAELMVYLGNTYFNAGDPVNGQAWHDKARQTDPTVFERLGQQK